ncbi:MAG TPA: inorganic phosphate transporter [Cytophagaceae bacterium]|jgi:PiT family inorganic phosphate transporter|nr:inorganic phosphate transporter [Cytophagaceae bacterium]
MSLMIHLMALPFIGEVNLSSGLLFIFLICLLAVVAFEFVNGFHDTANAVATVIYTKALKPQVAVIWSGMWNFLGVFTGGVAVAMGILKLVPLNEMIALPVHIGACVVLAVLLSSIVWNLGTWYFGIPCSSSHTLIGSMIGASLGFTIYYGGSGVNWGKAQEIGLSLIMSPLFGFGAAVLLMYFLKNIIKAEQLFHIPQGEDRPPILIRILLIITCTMVSFFHGSNDGQKGVGLLMLILMVFVPTKFALDHSISDEKILASLTATEQTIQKVITANSKQESLTKLKELVLKTKSEIGVKGSGISSEIFTFRKQIQTINKEIQTVLKNHDIAIPEADKAVLTTASHDLKKVTDYAPIWVIAAISISLGLGTMIGWKRIVLTIGEKIGKEHLNYAQGATAEIVAATTIGLSTGLGLPVSTTHVLSSGIAGAMVASKGTKNLNNGTLKSIALAWVLTLPVTILLSLALFVLFHLFV